MFAVAATALAIAPVRMLQRPVDQWPFPIFLAFVAFLSFTSAFYGVAVLKQKQRTAPHRKPIHLAVPALLLIASVAMFAFAASIGFTLGMLFAPLGAIVAVRQLLTLRAVPARKTWWLTEHLGAMIISTIATITAFLVVKIGAGGLLVWFVPTIVGVPLLIYWRRTYQKG
jgi:hypothetical protein